MNTASAANVVTYPGYIAVSAPTAFEAFSALVDALAKVDGDYEIQGPYGVGILGGQMVTGYGYTAKQVRSRSALAIAPSPRCTRPGST